MEKNMTSQSMMYRSDPRARPATLVRSLLATDRGLAAPVLRLVLAVVMFPHGAQKAFGWFGGYGWDGTIGFLTGPIGLPGVFAAGVILLELLGPLLLLAGFATRLAALGLAGIMLGAIATVHAPHGFFMNWTGAQAGEGFEYHLLVLGITAALVLTGGGRWSIDGRLAPR
jgi:putative oxidoreductase